VFPRDGHQLIHVARMSVQVDRHDGLGARGDQALGNDDLIARSNLEYRKGQLHGRGA